MSTILAIQRETNFLKLVQLKQTIKKITIVNYAYRSLASNADWKQVAQSAAELIKENNLQSHINILGLPSTICFLRQLWFPFSKQEKVRQIIKFELEQSFPQNIEDNIIDFIKTQPNYDGSYPFLAAIANKESIRSALSAFKEHGLDLDRIDLNLSGLEALARYSSANGESPGLFVNINWSGTDILFRSNKSMNKARGINIGLKHIAQSIESRSEKTETDMLSTLQRLRTIKNDLRTEDATDLRQQNTNSIPKAISDVLGKIVREIELTVTEAGQYSDDLDLKNVYLSGEASDLPYIQEELHKLLQIPVTKLTDNINNELLKDQILSEDISYIEIASGLALAQTQKSPSFNFRREEFAKTQSYTKWKKQIIYASAACALLFFSWLGSNLFQIHLLENRLNNLENKMDTVFQRAVPQTSGDFMLAQYPSIIKSKINQFEGNSGANNSQNYHKCLPPLRKISELISKNYDIKFSLYVFDTDRIRISGVADAFNTIENIKNLLQKEEQFSSVTIKGAKAANNNQGVNFSLQIRLV